VSLSQYFLPRRSIALASSSGSSSPVRLRWRRKWRWYDPPKRREILTQVYSVIIQKTWIFNSTAVRI
jgi:hypothetical protein